MRSRLVAVFLMVASLVAAMVVVGSPPALAGSGWQGLGGGVSGGRVYALATGPGGVVYAGGSFTSAGGATDSGHVAMWDGSSWHGLGSGVDGDVRALAVAPDGSLYAAGEFTSAGGVSGTRYVARWDGSSWHALGGGATDAVYALAVGSDGTLYAGGWFQWMYDAPGGSAVPGTYVLAQWNGSAWSGVGTGVTGYPVLALAAPGSNTVVAGGEITGAGGTPVANLAGWNGSLWGALGSGVTGSNHTVYALAVGPEGLYAGGTFSAAGGSPVSFVATWDGSSWSAMGAGTDSFVNALAVAPDGSVYAGGWFAAAGGAPANHVARWSGSSWSTLGTGTNGAVFALAVSGDGTVYAGGEFSTAGGSAAAGVAAWTGASDDPSTWTYPAVQQFAVLEQLTDEQCKEAALERGAAADWEALGGQRTSGWTSSWAQWPDGGTGGWVCTRQPLWNGATWTVR